MAKKITNINEAILNTSIGRGNKYGNAVQNDILYKPWTKTYAKTMDIFYVDFIAPRLPDPDVVMQWHSVIKYYANHPKVIFPIRAGNTKTRLRRGWLVNVNKSFSYMFTDNDLAVYIYKMALDGFCPDKDEFVEYMTEFKSLADIGWLKSKKAKISCDFDPHYGVERKFIQMPARFNRAGGSGVDATETQKNAYINQGPAPACCLGKYNYKHAHIIDVSGKNYEIPGKITPIVWEDIKGSLLGDVNDYSWDFSICNYSWKRTMPLTEEQDLRNLLTAHLFRFLDPLNHFLAPMSEQSRYINAEGLPATDIAEYEELQKYIILKKCAMFPGEYGDFIKKTCAPKEWCAMSWTLDSGKDIDLVYHEKTLRQSTYGSALRTPHKSASARKAGSKCSHTKTSKHITDTFADFKVFVGTSSSSSYCTSIRKIMREMGLNTLTDLEASLVAAINHCTIKMGDATTEKERTSYSNDRAALRRYKNFLLSEKRSS